MDHGGHGESGAARGSSSRRVRLVFLAFAAIGAYFLITEHRTHLSSILPWALFLAVPFLHFFMHSGHSHGRSDSEREDTPSAEPRTHGH